MANYNTTPPEVRFWAKVVKGGQDECWPWVGQKNAKGYGLFTPHPKHRDKNGWRPSAVFSHRLAWEYTFHKIIPKGMEACHTCDNRPCCNPNHIWIGTHKQNMEDMKNKGRAFLPKGELHGEHKLTEKQVVEIRNTYNPNVTPSRMLARKFGVSKTLILRVVKKTAWKHVA